MLALATFAAPPSLIVQRPPSSSYALPRAPVPPRVLLVLLQRGANSHAHMLTPRLAASFPQIDAEIKKLDNMDTEELEEMEAIRACRMQYMRNAKARKHPC